VTTDFWRVLLLTSRTTKVHFPLIVILRVTTSSTLTPPVWRPLLGLRLSGLHYRKTWGSGPIQIGLELRLGFASAFAARSMRACFLK